MKPWRRGLWLAASVLACASARPAPAAWNSVFQVCCHSCGQPQQAVSGYAAAAAPDPCCNPCPQPVCTTRYVQRCYYQPVTTYQTRSYYEPVTTYRTSYYYEPVTSYRYSCYYDPCTCSYQQVACPTTSYRLRSQCCPVQSWVQRCCQVPVTTYQQAFYYEPVTSCCTPPANPCCPTGYSAQGPAPQPSVPGYTPPTPQGPGVSEQVQPGAPGVREIPGGGTGSPLYDREYPPSSIPPASRSNFGARQVPPRLPVIPVRPVPATPKVRLDRVVSGPASQVEGQVVRNDNRPEPGARLTFVSAVHQGSQQTVTADAAGRFRVALSSGGWLVYVNGSTGQNYFHSKIDVHDNETRQVTLVSR